MMLPTEYFLYNDAHLKEVLILCTFTMLLVFIRAQKRRTNIVTYNKQTQVYYGLRKRINYAHRDPDVVVKTVVDLMKANYIDRYHVSSLCWLAERVSATYTPTCTCIIKCDQFVFIYSTSFNYGLQ